MRPSPRIPTTAPRTSRVNGKRSPRPHATAADEPVRGREAAQHVDDQEDREIGHRVGQHVGRVRHDDAAPRGLGHVDVVVADAEVHDRPQVGQGVHLGGARRSAATDDRHLDPRRIREVGRLRGGVPLDEPLAHEGHQPAELDDTGLGRVLGVGGHRAIMASTKENP